MQLFAKLWYEIYQTEDVDKKIIMMLCSTSSLIDYVDTVLEDERLSLNLPHIYQFFVNYFPKVPPQLFLILLELPLLKFSPLYDFFLQSPIVLIFSQVWQQILNDQSQTLYENIMNSIVTNRTATEKPNLTQKELVKILSKINGVSTEY